MEQLCLNCLKYARDTAWFDFQAKGDWPTFAVASGYYHRRYLKMYGHYPDEDEIEQSASVWADKHQKPNGSSRQICT